MGSTSEGLLDGALIGLLGGEGPYHNAIQKAKLLMFGGMPGIRKIPVNVSFSGEEEIYGFLSITYSSLRELLETGQVMVYGGHQINDSDLPYHEFDPPRPLTLTFDERNQIGYEIFGRVCHLIADMTVPAHVHNDPHVDWIDPDYYENYAQTNLADANAATAYLNGGVLTDIFFMNDPIRYLMYVNNQIADFFPSGTIHTVEYWGNSNYVVQHGEDTYTYLENKMDELSSIDDGFEEQLRNDTLHEHRMVSKLKDDVIYLN